MKTLRRLDLRHRTYFITAITFHRSQILLKDTNLFLDCWTKRRPSAWVVMPDHFHVMIDVEDESISEIMHGFKITYSRRFRDRYGPGRVWQHRFWDHIIRDQDDLNRHLDYVHFNPVHHGNVIDPQDWQCSSFGLWLADGFYEAGWGRMEKKSFEGEFGE